MKPAALLALSALSLCCWAAGYFAGIRDGRPADMLCITDDRHGNAVADLYGPDGSLWSTWRLPRELPIGTLFDRE